MSVSEQQPLEVALALRVTNRFIDLRPWVGILAAELSDELVGCRLCPLGRFVVGLEQCRVLEVFQDAGESLVALLVRHLGERLELLLVGMGQVDFDGGLLDPGLRLLDLVHEKLDTVLLRFPALPEYELPHALDQVDHGCPLLQGVLLIHDFGEVVQEYRSADEVVDQEKEGQKEDEEGADAATDVAVVDKCVSGIESNHRQVDDHGDLGRVENGG